MKIYYKNFFSLIISKIVIFFGYKYDESVIPNGSYCYTPDNEKNNNKDINIYTYYTIPCKYYKEINREWNGCKFCGIITDDYVFDDKCKICEINDKDEDYI